MVGPRPRCHWDPPLWGRDVPGPPSRCAVEPQRSLDRDGTPVTAGFHVVPAGWPRTLSSPAACEISVPDTESSPRLLMVTTMASTLVAFLRPFAAHLRSRGWRVDALAMGATTKPQLVDVFDHTFEAPWQRRIATAGTLGAVGAVRRVVSAGRYDVVHVHTPIASMVTRLALRRARFDHDGPRVLYTVHGFHFLEGSRHPSHTAFRTLERLAGNWTDHMVVMTAEDERMARRHGIVPPERLERVPGIGLDLDYYDRRHVDPEAIAAVRGEHAIPHDTPYLTMVAEFTTNKRQSDAVTALSRLTHADVHLIFVGGGDPSVPRQRAEVLGVADRVHFAGLRRDIRPYVVGAEAVLLVSAREGLPRSVMEAMSLGVPVVGTDTRGTRDLLGDDRGYLVPVGDVAAIAAAVDGVFDAPEEARRRVRRARQYVPALGLDTVLDRYTAMYEQLAASIAPVAS